MGLVAAHCNYCWHLNTMAVEMRNQSAVAIVAKSTYDLKLPQECVTTSLWQIS